MKIIGVSNYCLDNVSDVLIASDLNSYYGELIVEFLQSKVNEGDAYYPKLVEDNYELYEWEP